MIIFRNPPPLGRGLHGLLTNPGLVLVAGVFRSWREAIGRFAMFTSVCRSSDEDLSSKSTESEVENDDDEEEDDSDEEEDSEEEHDSEVEFEKYKIESEILQELVKALKPTNQGGNTKSYFAEGKMNSNDVCLKITGMGKIKFPIKHNTATKLINIATLASYGHGDQTKQDQNVRDTYMISKEKLNVTIKSLENTLKVIKNKLSLNKNSTLEAHLHNMLIYEQGQHFDFHQDTEKINNMIATLVVALPCAHTGGDLVIKHLKETHVFSTETGNGKDIKYITFYADCRHKIEKVKEGFRIVLTYNLILSGAQLKSNISCNPKVVGVLREYFKNERKDDRPRKLIYLFDHYYTKKEIKLSNLKGFDMQAASALLSAAKKLKLVVRLVFTNIHEVWDGENGDLADMNIDLKSWRDENNQPLQYDTYTAYQRDICWSKHNNSLEPYEVENSGYTGNEGITEERWYERAAMVLWPQSSDLAMQFELNYDEEFKKLKTLIESPNNLKAVKNIIKNAGNNLFLGLESSRNDKELLKTFVKLAIYMKNSKEALKICQHFCCDLFDCENYNLYLQLKDAYGSPWCLQLMNESGISTKGYLNSLVKFISVLNENDRTMIEQILRDQIPKAGDCYNKNEQSDRYGALVRAAYQTKCIDYVKDIFKAVVCKEWDVQKLAQFYILNCMDIQQDIVETLKERVVTLLKENISKYKEIHNKQMQWLSKVNFGHCKCELCKDMIDFLKKGGTCKRFVLYQEKRQHLISCFQKQNETLFSMTTQKWGSPYRLYVEKKIDMVDNVEATLAELENQLKTITEGDVGHHKILNAKSLKRSTQEHGKVDKKPLMGSPCARAHGVCPTRTD
ncbi:hypothetical protein EVAR_50101_1 [Eumeta japonica]|uniref:Uncharacterized protein n=1 Tax=Eumeta variegata TaxID=151549 RepID=A0A4C1XUT1_EUMVA|nr:hypothetical protein EVAR_50101_1 [Eumeta japonica]